MIEITKDLSDWCIEQVRQIKPDYTDEECLKVIEDIVTTNFPVCLCKYLKGEPWKLS